MRLSINLGARELTHPDAVTTVLGAVRRDGLPGCADDRGDREHGDGRPRHGFRALRDLSGEGVRVAIDDFGTGYSSLDQLRRMPVDMVKVDRSFVSRMSGRPTDRELVAAVVGMARALNLLVVAEGIETEAAGRAAARARLRLRPGLHVRAPDAGRRARAASGLGRAPLAQNLTRSR